MSIYARKSAIALTCALSLSQLLGCSDDEEPNPGGEAGANAAGGGAGGTAGTPSPAGGAGGSAGAANGGSPAGGASGAPAGGASGAPAGGASGAPAGGAGGDTAADPNVKIARSELAADTTPEVDSADYTSFITNLNDFGLALGQKLASTEEYAESNLIYSPLSVSVALGMTYAGTGTTTAAEFKSVLGDDFASGVFHKATNRLTRELSSRAAVQTDSEGKTRKVELNLVNSLWVERTLELEKPFLDLLGTEYDSGVRQVDYINAFEPARISINTWVEDQTKERIKDLLPMDSITPDTRIVLVNALYFYGSWSQPFRKEASSDNAFNTLSGSVQVPTMHGQVTGSPYFANDELSVAELFYLDHKLRMTIVLPAAGQFAAVRDKVSGAWLAETTAGLSPSLVQFALPKFKVTSGSFSLREGLETLGLKVAFTDQADLSGMSKGGGLSIADVVQKAFIEVDEDGTEAAAATAVIVGPTSAPIDPPKEFIVDRPFLYFIRDENGSVLFSGQVTDPSK